MGNCCEGIMGRGSEPEAADRKSSIKGNSSRPSGTIQTGILHSHTQDVYQKYKELEVLGRGSMGHVAKVVLKESAAARSTRARGTDTTDTTDSAGSLVDVGMRSIIGQDSSNASSYALKSILLDRISESFVVELKNEIAILNAMDHPNIVKLHEVISYKKQIYMILELCDGGDLYSRLPYTEKDSALITGKLLSAIKYMHDHAIVHRDLKFENIMFENKSAGAEIKVIDFGLSKKFVSSKLGLMKEGVGTLYSMAPQVLQGIYTSQADMWSVGVITYMLLSSHRPFYHKKRNIMIDKIMRCDYSFRKDYWDPVSDEAKDFIDNLLVLDPTLRYKARDAQAHKWMHKEFKLEDRAPTKFMQERVSNIVSAYGNNMALKKLALNVIAHRSTTDEIINLRKAFDQFDADNNGVISSEEFKAALTHQCSYTETEIKEMFDSIDINQNGHIMYTEFIAATLEAQGQLDEDRIAEAFERLDIDNSGFISIENMQEFLADTGMSIKEVEKMVEESSTNGSGSVSYDEFLAMFRSEDEVASANLIENLNKSCYFDRFDGLDQSDSNFSSDNLENLIGVDAVIPGGKHESASS